MFRKTIKYILTITISILMLGLLYLRLGAYVFLDTSLKERAIAEIKASPNLPNRFYELYEVVNPKSLYTEATENIARLLAGELLDQQYYIREVPSRILSWKFHGKYYFASDIHMLYYIEDHTTQKECLNALASHLDFSYNIQGIEEASVHYFNKGLKNLDDREMITLIVMMQNPSYYNPIRRPEKIEEVVNKYMLELE